jgi:hypothetical protein
MSAKAKFTPPKPLATPVLFLVFNRPDTTKQVFESIRESKPPRMYVAVDGPREHVQDESQTVQGVIDGITENIDWDCEVFTLIRKRNLGCKYAISEAISWFFENEEQGIILEDDCVPCQSFFWYCEEILNTYKSDLRIWHISGDNFQDGISRSEESYYFSKFVHVWGWATWRNRWKSYDVMMDTFPNFKEKNIINGLSEDNRLRRHWSNVFERAASQKIDTWDFQWTYAVKINNGLSVMPDKNLVSNIGFGADATHTKSNQSKLSALKTSNLDWPLIHPLFVVNNYEADKYTTSQMKFGYKLIYELIVRTLGYFK